MDDKIESDNQPIALVAIGIGAVVGVAMSSGDMGLWDLLVGLVLLVILRSYIRPESRVNHAGAYAVIWGFCFILCMGFIIDSAYFLWLDAYFNLTNTGKGICSPIGSEKSYTDLFCKGKPLSARDGIYFATWLLSSLLRYALIKRSKSKPEEAKDETTTKEPSEPVVVESIEEAENS